MIYTETSLDLTDHPLVKGGLFEIMPVVNFTPGCDPVLLANAAHSTWGHNVNGSRAVKLGWIGVRWGQIDRIESGVNIGTTVDRIVEGYELGCCDYSDEIQPLTIFADSLRAGGAMPTLLYVDFEWGIDWWSARPGDIEAKRRLLESPRAIARMPGGKPATNAADWSTFDRTVVNTSIGRPLEDAGLGNIPFLVAGSCHPCFPIDRGNGVSMGQSRLYDNQVDSWFFYGSESALTLRHEAWQYACAGHPIPHFSTADDPIEVAKRINSTRDCVLYGEDASQFESVANALKGVA